MVDTQDREADFIRDRVVEHTQAPVEVFTPVPAAVATLDRAEDYTPAQMADCILVPEVGFIQAPAVVCIRDRAADFIPGRVAVCIPGHPIHRIAAISRLGKYLLRHYESAVCISMQT